MLTDHFFDEIVPEKATFSDSSFIQVIEQKILEFGPQPMFDRDAETFFFSVDILMGKEPLHGFFKDPLGGEAVEFEIARERIGKFHDLVIQKRHSSLQGGRHAHPVDLDKNIVCEIGLQI